MSKSYVILLIVLSTGYYYLIQDKIDLFVYGSQVPGKIVSCESKTNTRMGESPARTNYISYAQVAESQTGQKAYGLFFLPEKKACIKTIGRDVTIFIHENDSRKNAINTFFNFWLLPYLGFYVLTCLIIGGIKKRVPIAVNFLLIFAVILAYLDFY